MSLEDLKFSAPVIAERIRLWASAEFDDATRAEIDALIEAGDTDELEDRFYCTLAFGTGGLRGVVGAGTNRMNSTIVSQATQGLATYVKEHAEKPEALAAAIAHDSRHTSREFAETAAAIFAANGFKVYISPEIRPTPYLSFVMRRLGCATGVVVTASHNPKQYNGYKVYWDDGSQVVPPHDMGIVAEVGKIESMKQVSAIGYDEGVADGRIVVLDKEMDLAYLEAVKLQTYAPKIIADNPIKIVYTPLHGVGGTMVPAALADWGFTDVHPEPEQMKPDGDFPTAASPNPEEGEALERAIALAKEIEADLVLATDPDADRLGIAIAHQGEFRLVTGNQLAFLICDYVLRQAKASGKLPAKPGVVSTIVTTPLVGEIARSHGAVYADVLTGFKWIAQQIRDWEESDPDIEFIYGTEESYGYMIGRHCRDKDGIVASCVTAEMAAWARSEGMTLLDYAESLYLKFGPRVEWGTSVFMTGQEGAEKIRAIMERIGSDPPKTVGGIRVQRRTHVETGKIYDGQSGEEIGELALPSSNVVLFDLEDGSRAVARPSGTEPKIKFYFFLAGEAQEDITGVRSCLAKLEASRPEFEKAFFEALGLEFD